jgi:hypothetical protein
MLERRDVSYYLQREREERAAAEASSDPKLRAHHRAMAAAFGEQAVKASARQSG